MTKLFVGGISYSVTNSQLEELFQKYGTVVSVNIITDKFSGQSKGFAFIEMDSDESAQQAIKQLDGYALEGRQIGVSVARPKEDNQNRSGYSNNNSGNFQRNNNFHNGNKRRR